METRLQGPPTDKAALLPADIANFASTCDLNVPQAVCVTAWDFHGAVLRLAAGTELKQRATAYFQKALTLAESFPESPAVLAQAIEFESISQRDQGNIARADELWARSTAIRKDLVAHLSDNLPANPASPPMRVSKAGQAGGVSAPLVTEKKDPAYSESARMAKQSGTVLLSLIVSETGEPRQIALLRSMGFGLDEAAVKAVSQWRFRPGTKDGAPVSVQATIEVNFRLL